MSLRRIIRRTGDDDGSVLALVLGLMLIIAVVTITVLSVSVTATSFATSSRANVQAEAVAQAGIDATRATLQSACTATGPSTAVGSSGTYQTTVSVPNGSGGWTPGCPTTTTTQVRIVSVGTASAKAVGANTSGDSVTVAAVLSPGGTATSANATGPAVYSYNVGSLNGSGKILPFLGSTPTVMVKTGDVDCSGAGFAGLTALVVGGGALRMSGSCVITGNVFSSGALSVEGGGRAGGDAVASAVTISGSAAVGGGVWTPGLLSLSGGAAVGGNVGGNASAANLSMSGSTRISGNAWITDTTTTTGISSIGGTLTTRVLSGSPAPGRTTVSGGTGPGASPYPTPTVPSVPAWLNYRYSASDWPGYTIVTLAAGTCGYDQLAAALTTIGTNPGVIDGRNCTGGVTSGDYQQLLIKNNVAIIAKSFQLGGSAGVTSLSAVKLWLITPDDTADTSPTCPSGGGFSVGGAYTFSPTIATMIYSPCNVQFTSANVFYGQVWAGQTSFAGASAFNYVPVGLPGYDLSTGTAATSGPRSVLSLGTVSGG